MSVEGRVKDHFDADAARFDAIYDDAKGPLQRFIDGVWRGVVRKRYQLVLERLEPLAGKSVLDVGCGSGRYCLAYAQRGATRVVGVDFAAAMIELARRHAARLGVLDRCDFRVGSFPEVVSDGPFDVSTAMGFFDYIRDPVPIVARMRELTLATMIMSFPKAREWRAPLRRLRFRLAGCPLFLYGEARVREILEQAGVERYDWIELDRDYVVVAAPSSPLRGGRKPYRVLHVITRLIVGGAQENTLLSVEGLDQEPDFDVTLATGVDDGPEGDLLGRARETTKLVIIPELGATSAPSRTWSRSGSFIA